MREPRRCLLVRPSTAQARQPSRVKRPLAWTTFRRSCQWRDVALVLVVYVVGGFARRTAPQHEGWNEAEQCEARRDGEDVAIDLMQGVRHRLQVLIGRAASGRTWRWDLDDECAK